MAAPVLPSTSALQSTSKLEYAFWLASQNNIHTFKTDHLHVFFSSFSSRHSPTHFSCCPHEMKFSCFILTQCHLCSERFSSVAFDLQTFRFLLINSPRVFKSEPVASAICFLTFSESRICSTRSLFSIMRYLLK